MLPRVAGAWPAVAPHRPRLNHIPFTLTSSCIISRAPFHHGHKVLSSIWTAMILQSCQLPNVVPVLDGEGCLWAAPIL